MAQKKNDYIIPLAIIGMMFFIVGFALGINSYIVPLLQGALNVSSGQSYLLLASTFAAFLLFSYPATALITKVGYKKTRGLAFAIFALGSDQSICNLSGTDRYRSQKNKHYGNMQHHRVARFAYVPCMAHRQEPG